MRDTYLGPWQGEGLVGYDATARDWAHFNGAFVVVYPPERADEVAQAPVSYTHLDVYKRQAQGRRMVRPRCCSKREKSRSEWSRGTSLVMQ